VTANVDFLFWQVAGQLEVFNMYRKYIEIMADKLLF
jgi:hypothetical protein